MMQYIVGIDEAGRGPLAGPVSVGLVLVEKREYARLKRIFKDIKGKDSKKLTEKQRERIFALLQEYAKQGRITIAHSFVGARVIDTKGIVWAVHEGVKRTLKRAEVSRKARVLLDGNLHAPERFQDQETLVRGDERELVIGLASIVAKVRRDRYMMHLAKRHSAYGFDQHKGYGTKKHRESIQRVGTCSEHRQSFLRSLQ